MYCTPEKSGTYIAEKTIPIAAKEGRRKQKLLPAIVLRSDNFPQSMIIIYSKTFTGKVKNSLMIKANYCPICGRFINSKSGGGTE